LHISSSIVRVSEAANDVSCGGAVSKIVSTANEYPTEKQMNQPAQSLDLSLDLTPYGIPTTAEIIYNPSYDLLFAEELRGDLRDLEKGVLTTSGAVAVDTGAFTGRSPKDKYIVEDSLTKDVLWWADQGANDNKPISETVWTDLKKLVTNHLTGKRLFVVDAFCGANENSRLAVRFVTEVAWQAHFVTNMFIKPTASELADFEPDFVVMNGASVVNDKWAEQGLNSENFVAFNYSEKIQLIGGTWYGGEMKKGLFSYMNFILPLNGIASMHCSANVGEKGDTAVFFGLSGTGKTTLSTDPKRQLIGGCLKMLLWKTMVQSILTTIVKLKMPASHTR